MVDPERLELPTPAFEAQCSIQLSYGSPSVDWCRQHCSVSSSQAAVGTAALGCPVSNAPLGLVPIRNAVEHRSTGQPRAAVPTWFVVNAQHRIN